MTHYLVQFLRSMTEMDLLGKGGHTIGADRLNLYSPCMSLVHTFHPAHTRFSSSVACSSKSNIMATSSMQGGGAGEDVGLEGEQEDRGPHGVGHQGQGE